MATILAPNKSHNGISAGVRFTAGVGETDNPAALAYFGKAGYTILPQGAVLPEPEPEPIKVPDEEVLHRPNGEPYSLAADGSIRSPFAPGPPPAPVPVKPLERMNKAELQAIASAAGLDTEGTNRELVARIRAARKD